MSFLILIFCGIHCNVYPVHKDFEESPASKAYQSVSGPAICGVHRLDWALFGVLGVLGRPKYLTFFFSVIMAEGTGATVYSSRSLSHIFVIARVYVALVPHLQGEGHTVPCTRYNEFSHRGSVHLWPFRRDVSMSIFAALYTVQARPLYFPVISLSPVFVSGAPQCVGLAPALRALPIRVFVINRLPESLTYPAYHAHSLTYLGLGSVLL